MALTRRQREVLDVIRDFIAENGYSPSLEEIGAKLGLSSVATVHKHVSHLVEKGFARRVWNQNRSIELVEGQGREVVLLPLGGSLVDAAELAPAEEGMAVAVPAAVLSGRPASHAVRVETEGLSEESVRLLDLVVLEARAEPRAGEIVLAWNGESLVLGRCRSDAAPLTLDPLVPARAPEVLDPAVSRVHGIVLALIRQY